MILRIKKNLKTYFFIFLLIIFISISYLIINSLQKEKKLSLKRVSINLLTSVHPNLNWEFKPIKNKITVKPGEVTAVEYIVENLGKEASTGIATFAYFPDNFGKYISKINCFCYGAQKLESKQKDKFILVLLIDPGVTKDSKTRNIKEATIQFTFFDYKEFKKEKN